MLGTEITLYMTAGLVALGAFEYAWHRRNLRAIPIRIHVNGTRGKSSVTRLIAAGLRQAGTLTCAKTTGTLARFILPDGRELPVLRANKPNIAEQIGVVAHARRLNAQALVIECMALKPVLQALCERQLIRATHGVITNVRPDHLDVMGPGVEEVGQALSGMVPAGGHMLTAETALTGAIELACADRGATLTIVDAQACQSVGPAELSRFSYTEHAENVALALGVLATLGIDRNTALQGMWAVRPDPGALSAYTLDFFGRQVRFVNGFAANDPQSTEQIWRQMKAAHPSYQKHIALFNCRDDRMDRSLQLGRALAAWPLPDHVVLMGSGVAPFARAALSCGLDAGRLIVLGDLQAAAIFESLIELVDDSAMIMGLGNIGGEGLPLVRYFRNRCATSINPGIKA